MRALIFDSGLGSRLGTLTEGSPKCLVRLGGGESILHRQLRLLSSLGVRDFVITTGPFHDRIAGACREFEDAGCSVALVRNYDYATTNYIHSMWLARGLLRGHDLLVLHGDLVFDAGYVSELLSLPDGSYGSVDPTLPVPEKDFSAVVGPRGLIRRVGVGIGGDGVVAFQAMYRLTPGAVGVWLDEIGLFEARGDVEVYAEEAANRVFERMRVHAHSYAGHLLEEVDTPQDLERVSQMTRSRDYSDQPLFVAGVGGTAVCCGSAEGRVVRPPRLGHVVVDCGLRRPLVVADPFFSRDVLAEVIGDGCWPVFAHLSPNPTVEQAREALRCFRRSGCESLVSVGGGSAIDVAKCVRMWAGSDDGCGPEYSPVRHVAVPTTAGTGSESTHFAVVYEGHRKTSVSAPWAQPDVAVLVPHLLGMLSGYQRRATAADALCHAVESHWSAMSTPESRAYSSEALPILLRSLPGYLEGDPAACSDMAIAANLAGRAINLTTTTLAHAMSYGITTLFGIAHGHAAALCLPFAWRVLMERGNSETRVRLRELCSLLTGGRSADEGSGLVALRDLLLEFDIGVPGSASVGDVDVLVEGIDRQRLSNFPVSVSPAELDDGYREALGLG